MAKGSMREQMPVVTDWIDRMRAAFGTEHIDGVIKAGMRGQPVFFASENGHQVGTPVPQGERVLLDERGVRCVLVGRDGVRTKIADDIDRQTALKGLKKWQR